MSHGALLKKLTNNAVFGILSHRTEVPTIIMLASNYKAPVVERADNFVHWIVRYPADKMCARFSR